MATTQQETDERPSRSHRRLPRLRKFASSKFVKLTAIILVVGAILWVFPRVAPSLVLPINGGSAFAVALLVFCGMIIRDHIRLGTSKKLPYILWVLFAGFAAYATVVMSYYDNRVAPFQGHLALFPLLALMVITTVLGIKHIIRIRKISARLRKHKAVSNKDLDLITYATYTGHLYLIPAALAAVVTAKLVKWFGPNFMYFYGEYHLQMIVFVLIAVCLIGAGVTGRPDMAYDENKDNDNDDGSISGELDNPNVEVHDNGSGDSGHPDAQSFLDDVLEGAQHGTNDETFYDPSLTQPVTLSVPPETDAEKTGPIMGTPIRELQPVKTPTAPQWPTDEQANDSHLDTRARFS